MPAPFRLGGDAVAGHPGLVMDDGDAAADDPVEQGGFPDIRTADDGDKTGHARRMRNPPARRKAKPTAPRARDRRRKPGNIC